MKKYSVEWKDYKGKPGKLFFEWLCDALEYAKLLDNCNNSGIMVRKISQTIPEKGKDDETIDLCNDPEGGLPKEMD